MPASLFDVSCIAKTALVQQIPALALKALKYPQMGPKPIIKHFFR
jgi:hypothetical protein